MEDLAAAALQGLDDFQMWIQRLFCRHKPILIPDYAVLCEKCGKHLEEKSHAS